MIQWTGAFELNSVTSGEEYTTVTGSPTVDGAVKWSGNYSMQINSLSSGTRKGVLFQFKTAANSTKHFFTYALYVTTNPSASNRIMALVNGGAFTSTFIAGITLESDGTLILRDEDGQIGSASGALTANTWYLVEVEYDRSGSAGSHIIKARLNGTEFAAATNRSLSAGIQSFVTGGNLAAEAQTTGDWHIDNMIINDATGSYNTSYLSPSSTQLIKTIKQYPNAAGDSSQWLKTAGGAGDSSNYQLVDEVNPNDATDYIQSTTLNDVDMYNCSDCGLSNVTILGVLVGGKHRNNTADASIGFKYRAMKTSGGTVVESNQIIPNSTAWRPNGDSLPLIYPVIMEKDPDGSDWTTTTLDSMQIGAKITADGTNSINITAMWAYVVYYDNPATTTAHNLTLLGVGA